ncbi:dual specificity tyrosine-phosphorylation-regulated kinase, putative [Entamoeba invadens IP1]|uniref:Dual specificity tyrosine-phosphorylation-regulated kinase, putative n=1 Tax=Entamoeba invadens IP1 TaxID=370355 RepID=L7FM04_ENTIV|nr:dual specificity tyrosine-phosphorylation-regulated kinase, putative [Entamoeba invadens IP1]ELP84893.1 dual specificity tyrosine-phosphorylation-regulated kinase, putative [Entamoeba invadens IP1]|eukprot:XP_004184239.1 dual specificity tyrosine-phosphorylation-regulated kinase, putative [Entamoeba invadens IP1]
MKKGDVIRKRYSALGEMIQGTHSANYIAIDMVSCCSVMLKTDIPEEELENWADAKKKLATCKNNLNNIFDIMDIFVFESKSYIVTEYLDVTLLEILNQRKPFDISLLYNSLTQTLLIFEGIGIIHTDIKPSNIMYSVHQNVFKVIDFGSSTTHNTSGTEYIQSRYYRAPEVIFGIASNIEIDVWSVGCVLAECILGTPLFPAESDEEHIFLLFHVIGQPSLEFYKKITKNKLFLQQANQNIYLADSILEKIEKEDDLQNLVIDEMVEDFPHFGVIKKLLTFDFNERATPSQLLDMLISFE